MAILAGLRVLYEEGWAAWRVEEWQLTAAFYVVRLLYASMVKTPVPRCVPAGRPWLKEPPPARSRPVARLQPTERLVSLEAKAHVRSLPEAAPKPLP